MSSLNHNLFIIVFFVFYYILLFFIFLVFFFFSEDIFSFGDFYALSRDEAFTLKNNERNSSAVFDCWAVYLNMIERNQELVVLDKELKAFLFTS